VRPVRDTARIARQLLRLGLRLAPLRTSLAFAVPLALVGVGSLGYHRHEVGRAALADASWLVGAGILAAIGLAAEQRVRKRRGRAAAKLVASPRLTT
ncbi:MAG TPA: hypothetical protein VL049_21540, partial [Candidatus Dormibacteraeota bacterium]|nr:hypothetical protein [Candidatus Dormibacteraeota bacterium]